MAPSGDEPVKLDVAEATEVSPKAVDGVLKTPEEYELEWAKLQQRVQISMLFLAVECSIIQYVSSVFAASEPAFLPNLSTAY